MKDLVVPEKFLTYLVNKIANKKIYYFTVKKYVYFILSLPAEIKLKKSKYLVLQL